MKILSFLSHPKRSLEWSYSSSGHIWRLLFSENGRIVGESRNPDEKEVSFFCVDEKTGDKLWEHLTVAEPWWVGMEAVQKNILLLHGFAKPDLPEHKGIRAFDIETGKPLWENKDLTFWFGYQNSVYAYKTLFERRIGYGLKLHTGEIVQEYDDTFGDLQAVRRLALEEEKQYEYRFPEVLDPDKTDPVVTKLIHKAIQKSRVVGEVEFVREREYLVFSYHSTSSGSSFDSRALENHLEVVEVNSSERVFSEQLASDAQAPVPDSFFVKGDFVYFIKNQHVLSALRLWKS